MSDQSTSPLRRIRTFAEDVRIARGQTDKTSTAKENAASESLVTKPSFSKRPEAAAVKAFENVPPEHIPSFHELQKKQPAKAITPLPEQKAAIATKTPSVTVRAKKPSVTPTLATPPEPPRISPSGGATIITDKNTNKVGFLNGIIAALTEWWNTQKRTATQKKTPTYAVPDVERRKGVVQKATSKTGTIFTADAETLREEIRRRTTTPPAPVATTQPTEPEISWSPNTEVGYPLLPSTTAQSTPHNIQVSFKKKTVPAPLFVEPQPIIPPPVPVVAPAPILEEVAVPDETEDDSRWEAPQTTPPSYTAPTTIPPQPPAPPVVIPEPALEPQPLSETVQEDVEPDTTEQPTPRLSLGKLIPPIKTTTNRLTVSITGAIILVVLLGIGAKMLVGALVAPAEVATLPPASPLIPGATTRDYPISALTEEALISAMQSSQVTTPTELRFIDDAGVPVKSAQILTLLGFSESKSFTQTVTQARTIVNGNNRGIVISVTDSMTAFGALLTFEPKMTTALSRSLAITNITDMPFTDKTINTSDIRIQTASDGTEILVYGFINRDTILITTSTASFISFLGNR